MPLHPPLVRTPAVTRRLEKHSPQQRGRGGGVARGPYVSTPRCVTFSPPSITRQLPPPPQGIRRAGTSEEAPEEVRQVVGGAVTVGYKCR